MCVLTLHGSGGLCVSSPVVFLLLGAVVADGRLLLATRAAGVDVLHGTLGEVCVTSDVKVPLQRPGTGSMILNAGTILRLYKPAHTHRHSSAQENTGRPVSPGRGRITEEKRHNGLTRRLSK